MSLEPLRPGEVVERYEVESVLGEGGMAAVYRVRHRTLGTEHALKVLTSVGVAARERLLLEGRAQARLRHPNLVAVTDVLNVNGAPGLLMEYVPAPTLQMLLLLHQLLSALQSPKLKHQKRKSQLLNNQSPRWKL